MYTVMLSKFFKEMYHHFWMGPLTVNANSATQRILELAIPSGATPEQMQAMQWASEYAAQNGVELIVRVIE